MKLRRLNSIDEASERDMLNYILASQLTILRRIDYLEDKLLSNKSAKSQINSYLETTKQMVNKNDTSLNKINEYLEIDDLNKGELNI